MANTTVKVPQGEGSITLTHLGETKRTYQVTATTGGNGTISVPPDELATVLQYVPGAELAKGEDPPADTLPADTTQPPNLPKP